MNFIPLLRTLFISSAAAALITGCSSNGAATDNQNNQNQAEQASASGHEQAEDNKQPPAGTSSDEDGQSTDETKSVENGSQSSEAPGQEDKNLTKEKAAEVLQKLKDTFMVETGKGGIVKNYDTMKSLLAHFKTVMSEDLAQSYLNVFFEMDDGKPKMIATEPPSWLEPDRDYQFNQLNPTTYHLVQRQVSELRGNRESTFELTYEGDHWIVNNISSLKIQKLTKKEAEDIVRQRLGNEIKQSTIVEFDHMEKDQFVIHDSRI